MIGRPRRRDATGMLSLAALLASVSGLTGCNPYTLRALRTPSEPDAPDERRIVAHAIFVGNEGQPIEPRVGAKGRTLPGDRYVPKDGGVVFVQDTAYGRYLHVLLDSIRADSARRGTAPRLLLRIHGGMNTLNGSLDASVRMQKQIRADTAAGYYPLFINWESGLATSYLDHLLHIRRGQRKKWPGQDESLNRGNLEPFTAPFYLLADLAGGVVRSPLTAARQFGVFQRGKFVDHQDELAYPPDSGRAGPPRPNAPTPTKAAVAANAEASAKARPTTAAVELALHQAEVRGVDSALASGARPQPGGEAPHGRNIALSRFSYDRSRSEKIFHHGLSFLLSYVPVRYFIPRRSYGTSLGTSYRNASPWTRPFTIASWLPPKLLGLIILDGMGPPAWDTMRRRTKTMFRTPNEFEQRADGSQAGQAVARYLRPTGALSVFLDSLQGLVGTGPGYRITLVGHSMGAIVASEITRTRDSLPIDNVVFMASAATVREFQLGVVPYLERHAGTGGRPATQFYNLTLHPLADQRERSFYAIAPYGSLLEWIDAYFANPETDLDRMFGKYDNSLITAHVIPDSIRGRVHFKAFGYRSGKGCGGRERGSLRLKDLPYRHGDFNDSTVAYWRSGFWKPGTAGCEEIKQNPMYVEGR